MRVDSLVGSKIKDEMNARRGAAVMHTVWQLVVEFESMLRLSCNAFGANDEFDIGIRQQGDVNAMRDRE